MESNNSSEGEDPAASNYEVSKDASETISDADLLTMCGDDEEALQ